MRAAYMPTRSASVAFGSTTGSAWISENQGDTWQRVSMRLPPINCLR